MESRTTPPPQASARQTESGEIFNRVLFATVDALTENKIPYALIGGIAASGLGRPRSTHDIDVFVRPEDADAALEALAKNGFETERRDPRWLFKGWRDEMMVDIIFKSQGDIYFDDEMQAHAKMISFHGRNIPAVSPEDLVIIKAAVHAEVGPHHWHDALAILSHAPLDWDYLIRRARRAPRRLLALLIYAQSNDIWIPNQVIHDLFQVIFGESTSKPVSPNNYSSAQVATVSSGSATSATPQGKTIPSSVSRPQPPTLHNHGAYLVGHINEALAADKRTASLDVEVAVGGKKILVKGEAPSHDHRRSIEEVITGLADGFEVENQIRITEVRAPHTEELV